MAIVDIKTVLDPPAKLVEKVKDTLRALTPHPSDEIRDKHRWYQCTVQNATQFEIRLEDSYFNAGKYLTAPKSGLDAPMMGGFKASVVESNSAKTGLENATREGRSIASKDQYKGEDSDGDDRVIEFHVVAYPGMEMKATITQLIVDSSDE
ncbi:polyketide synthase [Fusarium phyllophilum]|uniref:Polyketide synthase n=1 Tax=Fusarium phyllophilum TaxID=47803 RepID=A0A8H5NMY5_9HYPO|nr:polyketide synthase [Fusarium phyllophilum]